MTRAAPDIEEVLSARALKPMGAGHQPCRRSLSRCLFSRFDSGQRPMV
nr:Uncharacterised protein [Salmonella sp. NCTC 7297]